MEAHDSFDQTRPTLFLRGKLFHFQHWKGWRKFCGNWYVMSIKKLVLFCYSTHSSSNPKSIQMDHRNRCTVFVFVQGFCVLSKWRAGAWLGGVQQWSPPPPSLFLWCQASSAVPGHWPLHPPGTVYSQSSIFNLMLNHSVNVTLEV